MKGIFVVYCTIDYEGISKEGITPYYTLEQAEHKFSNTNLRTLDVNDCYLEKWVLGSDEKEVLRHKRLFGNETIMMDMEGGPK